MMVPLHLGSLLMTGLALCGAVAFGLVALVAWLWSFRSEVPGRFRAKAGWAAVATALSLLFALACLGIPETDGGDTVANVLFFVWAAALIAGMLLLCVAGRRRDDAAKRPGRTRGPRQPDRLP